MENHDIDDLLERAFSGDAPGQAFRARVLLESTAALVRVGRDRARWRLAALSAAAVFIATVSFFMGRCSAPTGEPQPTAGPTVVAPSATIAVPNELVEWLDAAQLFRQLGMTERMARAVERASRLLPHDVVVATQRTELVLADGESAQNPEELFESADTPYPSMATVNRILAGSFGD